MISVWSDLHGNAKALQEARGRMQEQTFCLGDTVGYRRYPEEAVRLAREAADLAVQGNHDAAGVGQFDDFLELVPPWLRNTIEDTEEIDEDLFGWLATLPRILQKEDWTLVHGSLRDPWMEFMVPEAAPDNFLLQETHLAFVGHTHKPLALSESGQVFVPSPQHFRLDVSEERWILNPGSLGVISAGQSWMDVGEEQVIWRWL